MNTTPGVWIVKPAESQGEGTYLAKIIAVSPNGGEELVSLVLNMADVALQSTAKELLDTLIAIHHELNTSKETIDLGALNEMISMCIEKIAAEAGETG